MKGCYIIAEAGVNHNGCMDLACSLVRAAAEAGADAVKFQTFKAETLVSQSAKTADYQHVTTGAKDQFSMLRELELPEEALYVLSDLCKSLGIEFLSTPFDIKSAELLLSLGMQKIKIPSGELTNLPFIKRLAEYNKPIILSTGMSDLLEIKEAVAAIKEVREQKGFSEPLEDTLSLLHCTSNYPTANTDVNLLAIKTMWDTFRLPVGYSDHTSDTFVAPLAIAVGAEIIEKHFTVDKDLPGPDHQASLSIRDLKSMIADIRKADICMGDGTKKPCEGELPIRDLVRRSLVLSRNKKAGDVVSSKDLVLLRPGTGILPKYLSKVEGMILKNDLDRGSVLTWDQLENA